MISIALLILYFDFRIGSESGWGRPGLIMAPMVLLLALAASSELLFFRSNHPPQPIAWVVYLGTVMIVASSMIPMLWSKYPEPCSVGRMGWPLFGMAAALGVAFLAEIERFRKPGDVTVRLGMTVLIVAYIGLLASFIMPIRTYYDNAWGMVAFLSLALPVKLSDATAYGFGKTFGKNKLAPLLSPGKTVEGAFGSLVGGCVGSFLVFAVIAPWITAAPSPPWYVALLFGVVVALVGMFGDMAESLLKRDADKKNSSRWLPGLGGIMDVIDSPIAAAPAVYAFWATGLLGPVA